MIVLKNILYFLKRFGSKTVKEYPFNEVDGLILAQLSYLNLDNFIPKIDDTVEDVNLLEVLTEENLKMVCQGTLDRKNNEKLLRILKKTLRYRNLKANYFSNIFDIDKEVQFCAVTFLLDEFMFIAYRGTDISLLGWKEDFNMSFLDVIPSQKEATRYLERVSSKRSLPIYLSGHSKGGNLAVYAALSAKEEYQDRIINILDYDGPGFQTDIYRTNEFKKIQNKINKYSCGNAMVGILLHHSEHIQFVKAKGVGIFQHDPYNWLITKEGKFRYVKNVTIFSLTFEKTVGDFIETTSIEHRKKFLTILFKVGMEHSYSTVLDWVKHPFRSISGGIKRYRKLSKSERRFFHNMIHRYRILWQKNFMLFLKNRRRKNKHEK